jgi:hypothetical protein
MNEKESLYTTEIMELSTFHMKILDILKTCINTEGYFKKQAIL